MNKKLILASAISLAFGVNHAMATENSTANNASHNAINTVKPNKLFAFEKKTNYVINADNAAASNRYIIQLRSKPLALAVNAKQVDFKGVAKLNVQAQQSQTYLSQLKEQHVSFVQSATKHLGKAPKVLLEYNKVFNGMAMELTAQEAEEMLKLPQVLRVVREIPHQHYTDVGPQHIGADAIWQGSTSVAAKGEGIVFGLFDSGINTDSKSFAAKGGDDYQHINPNGTGSYFGDCETNAALCNDKLIGVYSFDQITGNYGNVRPANGEDYSGHGSHVGSTTAGNTLYDVPIVNTGDTAISDGVPIPNATFSQISGVAPHANIISYQVCDPSGACYPSLSIAALEAALENGTDVINYSIGPSSEANNPWQDPLAMAFLGAREAGIFVAVAAGNNGPYESTVGNVAPWTTSVANATHGRVFEKEVTGTDDLGSQLAAVSGLGVVSEVVTAGVVYAGDLGDGSKANCDFWFWGDDFPEIVDKIVICDRGDILLSNKADNVKRKGGAGMIIRNTPDSNSELYSISYSLPGILIDEQAGNDLMSWVTTATNPVLTINAGVANVDPSKANVLNASSSRGPFSKIPDLMVPHISAPGTDIYAAYADELPFSGAPAPADYSFLSGTSMASPHIAGSAVLLKQLHPDWSPAEIQSALMLTSDNSVNKEDGVTAATLFDQGSGMAQVDKAAQSGLVMDIAFQDYIAANPTTGGNPSSLNTAYIIDSKCPGTCTWTRTFKATKDATWQVSTDGLTWGLDVSVSPREINMTAGQEYSIEITANFNEFIADDWHASNISLTPSDPTIPAVHLPFAIRPLIADIPKQHMQAYYWKQAGFDIDTYRFRRPENVVVASSSLQKAQSLSFEVAQDSDPINPFDDITDGFGVTTFKVVQGTDEISFYVAETTSVDVDIFVGFDSNQDGLPQLSELECVGASQSSVGETCTMTNPMPGNYWLGIQNYQASDAVIDTVLLDVVSAPNTDLKPLSVSADTGADSYGVAPMSIFWGGDLEQHSRYYGQVDVYETTGETSLTHLGTTQLVIANKGDDVVISTENTEIRFGDITNFKIAVQANPLAEPLNYQISMVIDDAFDIVELPSDIVTIDGQIVTLNFTKTAKEQQASEFIIQTKLKAGSEGEFIHSWQAKSSKSDAVKGEYIMTNPNSKPTAMLEVTQTIAEEESEVTLSATGSADIDDDELTYNWKQISGVAADMTETTGENIVVTMPSVESISVLEFELTVSDGDFFVTENIAVTVNPQAVAVQTKKSSGGSFSILLLLSLSLAMRRKIQKS